MCNILELLIIKYNYIQNKRIDQIFIIFQWRYNSTIIEHPEHPLEKVYSRGRNL